MKEMIKIYFPKPILKSYIIDNEQVIKLDELISEESKTSDPEQLIVLNKEKIEILKQFMRFNYERDVETHSLSVNPKIKYVFSRITDALRGLYLGLDIAVYYSTDVSESKFVFSSKSRDIIVDYVVKKYNIDEKQAVEYLRKTLFASMKLRTSTVIKRIAVTDGLFSFIYEYINERDEICKLIKEYKKIISYSLDEMNLEQSKMFDMYKPRLSSYINEFSIFSSVNTYIRLYYPRNIDEIIERELPLMGKWNALRLALVTFTTDAAVVSKLAEYGRFKITLGYKNYVHEVKEYIDKFLNLYEKTLNDALHEAEKCVRRSKLDFVRKQSRNRKYTFDEIKRIFIEAFGNDADKMIKEAIDSGYIKYTDDGYFVFSE